MTSKNLKFLITGLLLVSFIGMIGCGVNNDSLEDQGYSISNDEGLLGERLSETNVLISIESGDSAATKQKRDRSFSLNLVAEIDAPVVDGVQTQATMVSIFGNSSRASVSYNVQGAGYTGAVDAVQVTSSGNNAIRVRSGIEFTNAKANAVYVDNNNIWIAHSSEDPSLTGDDGFSAARKFGFRGFNINDNPDHSGLPGFAANSIHESSGIVYVTSGNNAGLTLLNNNLSQTIEYIEIPGARWVDTDENRIVVLANDPDSGGTLYVIDKGDTSSRTVYEFDGADTPEAKNTVEIKGDLALVAAGRSGTHLIDLVTGELIATIPVPDAASLGLNPDAVESNAASADEEFIFISNGEAGVYVAEASSDLNDYVSGSEISVELLGYLKFDDFQSANHVAYRNNTLFVAAGLGGVKAVKLNRN